MGVELIEVKDFGRMDRPAPGYQKDWRFSDGRVFRTLLPMDIFVIRNMDQLEVMNWERIALIDAGAPREAVDAYFAKLEYEYFRKLG